MNGTILKEKNALRRSVAGLAASRAGRTGLEALAYGAGGALLAALPLLGGPAPLAACAVLCGGVWLRGTALLLGACGGYLLFWGWAGALEPLALALSCFAGAVIFRRTPVSRAGLATALCLAVGGIFLLDTGFSPLPLLRLGLGTGFAALLPGLWERAAAGRPAARLGAGALLLLALAGRAAPLGQTGGLAAAFLLPVLDNLPRPEALSGAVREESPLPPQKAVEQALHGMYALLAREDPLIRPVQLAEVYDFAAEQVCRCCLRYSRCWEEAAEDTYRDLCAAGEAILQRGAAEREDLPERFTARCCHTAGFLTAVNQALDSQLLRRREDSRRAESCRVAAGQYLALERLLAALARPVPKAPPCYTPELAVGSAARDDAARSGDRGAAFRDVFGGFYVLLCDGMGTGAPARAESDRATRFLKAFLAAGLAPDTALELVNGFFLLRKQTAFATLDLLWLDLHSGEGTLYKWGAAPSYLRRGETVEKIGTATPPPGLEAAEGRVPGQYELSLREGETLVMVSDGAYGEETEQRLTAFSGGTVRDLASCLITLGQADTADDRTAVVLRLRKMKKEE